MHGNLKDIPKLCNSLISSSQCRNCEIIIDTSLLKYLNFTTQSFCMLFLTQLTRLWNIFDSNQFHWKLPAHNLQNQLLNYLPFRHICVYNLCRCSDTGITMTSQRRWHAHDSENKCIDFQQCTIRHHIGYSLADFDFVMYQSELIHFIIGLKHRVPCIVRLGALRGH